MQRPDETWHRLLNWTYGQAPSERLAAQVLLAEGYTDLDPSHPLGGKDGGKDALCIKDGKRWLMAVYFPRGQQGFTQIQNKFKDDFAGVANNGAAGIAFVTNQELTLGERSQLKALCGSALVEIYHLERITTILDQPGMAPVRQQFLYIDIPTQTGLVLGIGWHSIVLDNLVNGCVAGVPVQPKMQTEAGVGIESFLTWQSRIPAQLIGRDAEMADLYAWATSDSTAPRIRLLTGMGGIGKTRLAVELGDRLREEGWGVCLVGSPQHRYAFAAGEQGNLLLIDYPELYPEALGQLLDWFKSGQLLAGRWRIVLLSRDERLAQTVDQRAPGWRDESLALAPLPDDASAWQLFEAASAQMQHAMGRAGAGRLPRERFANWLAQDTHHHDPLIILAFALNLQYQPEAWLLGHAEILGSLVRHEIARMKKGLTQFGREQQRTLLLLKGLAALTGSLGASELQALRAAALPADGLAWPSLPDVKESTLWQGGQIAEIQPDRVAAYFLHQVVGEYIEGQENAWLWQCLLLGEPDDALLRARLGRLGRLAWDYAWQNSRGGYGVAECLQVDAALAERLEPLFANNAVLEVPLRKLAMQVSQLMLAFWGAKVANGVAEAQPQLALRLLNWAVLLAEAGKRGEALAANTKVVQIYENLARQNFVEYGPYLASSLNNWALDLSEAGRQSEALAAIERAVQIDKDLAQTNFAEYGPNLAGSLNNWANRLADAGQRSEALATSEWALQIREDLARQNFSAHGRHLAQSLINWSNRLAEAGRRTEALAAIERAVQIDGDLAQENFASYGNNLAQSLTNLSIRLGEVGQRAEAISASKRAVQIYDELARQNFAAYGGYLATSLINLSIQLSNTGQRIETLGVIERAVLIFEDLARKNFAAYGTNLASGLDNWAVGLSEVGQRTEALEANKRAVQIWDEFARKNFTAHGPHLARSVNNLSNRLAEAGKGTEALAASERAVQIKEDLAQQNFAAYGPDLASGLNNWSSHLAEAGRRTEALAAMERAVEIREDLAQQNFAAYGPDLAASLNNWANQLAAASQRTEALAVIKRALQIYEDLARHTPAVYEPNLAGSLCTLANLLPPAAAIPHVRRALTLIAPYAQPGTTYQQWRVWMEQYLQDH